MTDDIGHLERRVNDFVGQVNKRLDENNNKLDLLIDLTRQMAVLQEKQDHNTEDIRKHDRKFQEKEEEIHEVIRKIEERNAKSDLEKVESIRRLHARIDQVEAYNVKACNECDADKRALNEKSDEKLGEVDKKIVSLEQDYHNRVSFFKGLFFAFAIISGAFQFILYKYFGEIENNSSETKVAIQKIDNRFNETERQIDLIHSQVRNLKK
jgi:hypothetical protein